MPDSAPTDDLWARLTGLGYSINVMPQDRRINHSEEIVEVTGKWQWNVKMRSANLRTGHSCDTPQIAFDRALSALRELAALGEVRQLEPAPTYSYPTVEYRPGYASGGFTMASHSDGLTVIRDEELERVRAWMREEF